MVSVAYRDKGSQSNAFSELHNLETHGSTAVAANDRAAGPLQGSDVKGRMSDARPYTQAGVHVARTGNVGYA
jgi:hypothetical protein